MPEIIAALESKYATDDKEQIKATYRSLVASILRMARAYKGTEAEYQALLAHLSVLENFVTTLVRGNIEGIITTNEEQEIASWAKVKQPREVGINSLLGRTGNALDRNYLAALQRIHTIIVAKALLPAQLEGAVTTGEDGGTFEIKFEDRLKPVIYMLQSRGVFVDDLVLAVGPVIPGAMRKRSYIQIDIPRIQKSILICEQVGEGTFVLQMLLPREIAMTHTKTKLVALYGGNIKRIDKRNDTEWIQGIEKALFENNNTSSSSINTKVNVEHVETVRTIVTQSITAQQWRDTDQPTRKRMKIPVPTAISATGELGIMSLSTIFGFKGNSGSDNRMHIEAGIAIFGAEPLLLEAHERIIRHQQATAGDENAREYLRTLAKTKVPTPEEWIAITNEKRRLFECDGVKMHAFATLFGIEETPLRFTRAHLALGIQIYGEVTCLVTAHTRIVEKEEAEKGDTPARERLRVLTKEQIATDQDWIKMDGTRRKNLRVDGYSLNELDDIFNTSKGAISNLKPRIELGMAIYGPTKQLVNLYQRITNEEKALAGSKKARNKIRKVVKKHLPNSEIWLAQGYTARTALKIGPNNIGLTYLGSLFGINGNCIGGYVPYIELGMAMYGSQDIRLQAALARYNMITTAKEGDLKARTSILKLVREDCERLELTADNWSQKNNTCRSQLLAGLGLAQLSTCLGLRGKALDSQRYFLELGTIIFPESQQLRRKHEASEIYFNAQEGSKKARKKVRRLVREKVKSANMWVNMAKEEKRRLHFGELGIEGIARLLGIIGEPSKKTEAYIELGTKVYGSKAITAVGPRLETRGKKRS
jgi:hypothetical protein